MSRLCNRMRETGLMVARPARHVMLLALALGLATACHSDPPPCVQAPTNPPLEPCRASCTRWQNGCQMHIQAVELPYCGGGEPCFGSVCTRATMVPSSPGYATCRQCLIEQGDAARKCAVMLRESLDYCDGVTRSCRDYCVEQSGGKARGGGSALWRSMSKPTPPLEIPNAPSN